MGADRDGARTAAARRPWRWLAAALLLLAGMVLLAGLLWEGLAARAPVADPLPALSARILRDAHGVPHIHGATDPDVAFGLAWAHAEDDFPTIQQVVAATRGRSAAIGGRQWAPLDYLVHLTDARAVAERRYLELPADTRALLEAYAAGLNAWAASHPEEVALARLFPVTGRDIVTGFVQRAPLFYGLDRVLTPLAEGRLPPRDGEPEPGSGQVAPPPGGSNAFAIAPRRSGDGATRLIANSHQPWTGPVAWWEAVVRSDRGWHFAGALFPGTPYPLLGHNRHLGWTNTVNRPDLIDTYRLVVSADGRRYRLDGAWRDLERRRIWIGVRMGPFTLPVPRTVLRSAHGFVIENPLGHFAIRHAGHGEVAQVDQYYRLNRAGGFDEWMAAMRRQAIIGTNFVYADAGGRIAFVYNARFPERLPGLDWRGILPGDRSDLIWTDHIPFSRYPAVIDAPAGWVANANNRPWLATAEGQNLREADFPAHWGIERHMTNRAHRFAALLAGDDPIPLDRLLAVKFDKGYARESWAGAWVDRLLAVDPGAPGAAALQPLVRAWDWTLDGKGAADAAMALLIGEGARRAHRGASLPDAAEALADVHAHLLQHWGRLDPPLADLLRVRRGSADEPTLGGPDALRAFYWERDPDGRARGINGDSFIMLVEWLADGTLRSRSVQPFGAAIERPDSPHHSDQAALFARERWKPVRFEPADAEAAARRRIRVTRSADGALSVAREPTTAP